LWILLFIPAFSFAQSSHSFPAGLTARFVPGKTAQYEFDGLVHITAIHTQDVKVNIPDECSYRLRAILDVTIARSSREGSISGHAGYRAVRYDGPTCALPSRGDLTKELQRLGSEGTDFEINPAGDVHLKDIAAAHCEGASILLRAVWDVLQVRLSERAISPGPASLPSRRFLYWPDTFVEGMEVAATSMRYERDATVAGQPYAWLQYKQVFSPSDMPAYVETRSQARDFTGTTYVTGQASASVLFDRSAGRIVYVHRERKIDNRMALKYEPVDETIPVATYAIGEESSVRWLPEKGSEAWLAALHKFETEPVEGRAVLSGHKPTVEPTELSELVDRPPRGFQRWSKNLCSNAYCFALSLAVPERIVIAENTDTTALLLSGSGGSTVSIAVGPALDRQSQNLSDEELLEQQSRRFVANYLWFAGGDGQALNLEIGSVHDRPAAFRDFIAVARDLKPIRGRLVMVIGPYNRLIPVTCSFTNATLTPVDSVCQTVTGSIVLY
jgi:hypothetical protein